MDAQFLLAPSPRGARPAFQEPVRPAVVRPLGLVCTPRPDGAARPIVLLVLPCAVTLSYMHYDLPIVFHTLFTACYPIVI